VLIVATCASLIAAASAQANLPASIDTVVAPGGNATTRA
jgi:hypothetical protein